MASNTKKITDEVSFFFRPSLKSFGKLAEEAAQLEDMKLLFGRFIPEGTLIHFPSPRGVGKSFFCMQLCTAVAYEQPEFLGEPITLHGNTLYINNELSEKVLRRRSEKLMSNLPFSPATRFKPRAYTTKNSLADDLPAIIQIVERLKPVLIIIDNLRMAFADTDTNSNKEITRMMFTLLALCESSKTAIVVTDHFRKHTSSLLSDSDLQAGSGVKTDLADGDFFLRKSAQDKNLRLLKRGKSRHFEEADRAKLLRLNPQTLWFELVEDDVNEAEHIGIKSIKNKEEQLDMAKLLQENGKSIREIAGILGKSKSTVQRWLNKPEGDANGTDIAEERRKAQ
ncbi:AAA family ATPase [Niabella sp. CC-SYL272]|uniref:AAA family ATPase n=1 Tax=Niabella agricola TaxID=2891571 RepID=UPI001F343ADD|nr:AAA family ATPase [Niabella agricola]MCF3109632.1 AAA family ATPase [Niabella agricola]